MRYLTLVITALLISLGSLSRAEDAKHPFLAENAQAPMAMDGKKAELQQLVERNCVFI